MITHSLMILHISENEYKYADVTIASDFDGNVNFVAGFNMLENETVNLYDVYFNGGDAVALAPILSGARLYPSHYRNLTNPYELERKGVFAQVYIDVNEDTQITLGARWNESEKRVADAQQFLNSIILAGGTSVGDPVLAAAIQRTDPNLGLVFAGLAPHLHFNQFLHLVNKGLLQVIPLLLQRKKLPIKLVLIGHQI